MTDSRAMSTAPSITRLADYEVYPFAIDSVNLTFELDPTRTRVTQSSQVRRVVGGINALELNGKDLKRISVKIDGVEVGSDRIVEIDETLLIRNVPEEFRLEVVTEINPETNTALEGLYLSNGMYCTQCEAEGFRRITYYPDRPDVMSIFTTRIISDRVIRFCCQMEIQSKTANHLMDVGRSLGTTHFPNLAICLRWLVVISLLSMIGL